MTDYNPILDRLETGWDLINFGKHEFEGHHLYFGHGTNNALDEALALAMHVLACPYEQVDEEMPKKRTREEKEAVLQIYDERIKTRKPAPYLTNTAYFCGLPFYVNETVLIPRSPIAELIENQFSPWVNPEEVNDILELCTGSGCIAIALAYAFEKAHIDATDISKDVLEIAQKNITQHQVGSQVSCHEGDLFQPVPKKKYQIIVTNPPYVCQEEMAALPEEYQHEPRLALHADDNGLKLVDIILAQAKDYLAPAGILVVEVGNSADALQKKYPEVPFVWLEFERGGEGVFLLNYNDLLRYF